MNPIKAYKETNIKTASQGKLLVMLYEEALKQLDFAIRCLDSKSMKLDKINTALIKTQDIITELMVSLDFEKGKDIAKNLFSLYMYFNQRIMEANMKKDSAILKEIRPMLKELSSAWVEIVQNGASAEDNSANSGINIAG